MQDVLALCVWTFCSFATASPPSVATPKQAPQLAHASTTWIPQKRVRVVNRQWQRNDAFVASISVGTPPQSVRCKVDTGFADVWLSARVAEQSQTLVVPLPLQEGFAKTPVKDNGKVLEMTSPGGTLRGYQGKDTIHIGSRVLQNQSLFILDEASLPEDRNWDGICGLGRQLIATKVPALYSRVASASPGGLAVFGLIPGSHGQAYTVVEKVPLSVIKPGTLAWVNAEPAHSGGDQFWAVPGSIATNRRLAMHTRFILDTGMPFLLVPPSKYMSLVQDLIPPRMLAEACGVDEDTGNVVCDCSVIGLSDVMPLHISLGEQEFIVNFTDLFDTVPTKEDGKVCQLLIQKSLAKPTDPSHLLVDFLRSPSNRNGTSSGIGPYGSEADVWVMGSAFLKRFCLFFDFEKNRVGLAEPATRMPTTTALTSKDALGTSTTGGKQAEFAADVLVLAAQKDWLKKNITELQKQLQVAKEFNEFRESESKKDIFRLEDEQKALHDRQSSLLLALAEVREKKEDEEAGTSPAVLQRVQQENDQLRVRLVLKQEELQRSEGNLQPREQLQKQQQPDQQVPLFGPHTELKALSMQNGKLLEMTVDLRHKNQNDRKRQANFYVALLVSCVASSTVLLLGTYSKLANCLGGCGVLRSKSGQEANPV
mmetsp:Transcript_49927/g.99086  ORF Transcript_49927/g.99086 Transcript_49927/m.99086 type:complete len:652 (+) Transcript_49927:53-2008(+)